MKSAGPCPNDHPRRGPGGLDIVGSFEPVGRAHCDVWGRCRECGGWLWSASTRAVLIGADGLLRAGFEAEGARFSVTGTRAGPYVIEPRRLRVAAFCAGDARP